MHKIALLIALSSVAACAMHRPTVNAPKAETAVIGIEIRSLPDFQLVDDLEFDVPVTVTRGPCHASLDCLLWTEDGVTVPRELHDDWVVTYRYAPTVVDVR